MVITQKKDDPLTLPTGVAYTLHREPVHSPRAALQSTPAIRPKMIQGNVDFYDADPATITDGGEHPLHRHTRCEPAREHR